MDDQEAKALKSVWIKMSPSVLELHRWVFVTYSQSGNVPPQGRERIAKVAKLYGDLLEMARAGQEIPDQEVSEALALGIIGDVVIMAEPYPTGEAKWILRRKQQNTIREILPVTRSTSTWGLYQAMQKASIPLVPGLLDWASRARVGDKLITDYLNITYTLEVSQ
jgi:hypothetical protein